MRKSATRWLFVFATLLAFLGITLASGCSLFKGKDDEESNEDSDSDVNKGSDNETDDTEDTEEIDTLELKGQDPCAECAGFEGVDLLVVVDNSISMMEEQQILATGFFTLINQLVNPPEVDDDIVGTPTATDVRLAVTSSDLALQYGKEGTPAPAESDKVGCVNGSYKGDNGLFLNDTVDEIEVESNRIRCLEDGGQCPTDEWQCVDGYCVSPDESEKYAVECPTVEDAWLEATEDDHALIATQTACLAQLGTDGCGVEQQLQAGIRALTRDDQKTFIRKKALLAVIVVSDEEDCSIESEGLFETSQWKSTELYNTACNLPTSNEDDYLFSIDYFYKTLLSLKDGKRNAVVFAGIVGVPTGGEPCEGTGDQLTDCLAEVEMQLRVENFTVDDIDFVHFKPACTRELNGVEVTSARPGRRYVKLAEKFSCNGYIYSICNADWSKAMSEIARLISKCQVIVVK